jgi:acetyl esterase
MRRLSGPVALFGLSLVVVSTGAARAPAAARAAEPSGPGRAADAQGMGAPVLSGLEPRTRAFVEALTKRGGLPIYKLPVAQARALLDGLQKEYAPSALAPAEIEDTELPVGPTGSVPVRIVRPTGSAAPLPVIVYFHGGGWILGNVDTHDRLLRALSAGARAAVVFVKYTPSPEARFPVPLEQAYATTRYLAENGACFGLDGARLAVAGDSVGGNMAAVVAQLARKRGGPEIRYQALFYPVTDARQDTASYQRFAAGPWLTRRAMDWFFDAYAPDHADREKPEVSPLRASLTALQGLPPALVLTDENDVLRDEGEAYAHRLMDAGVPVTAVRYLGTMHDFMMLNALADTEAARSATALASEQLGAALAP